MGQFFGLHEYHNNHVGCMIEVIDHMSVCMKLFIKENWVSNIKANFLSAIDYGRGYGNTSMLLTNVGCAGSESNITSCCATRISDTDLPCHSRRAAGGRCESQFTATGIV